MSKTGKMRYMTRAKAKHELIEAQGSRDHRSYIIIRMRSSIDYKRGVKLWYRGLHIREELVARDE